MKPSGRILDRNLEALLRRAYVPVLPRPELRARIVATGIAELERARARAPRRRARIRTGWRLVAAAAVLALCWVGGRALLDSTPEPADAAGILARGEVALSWNDSGEWIAATAEELTGGIELGKSALELATPPVRGATVQARLAEVRLRAGSRGWTGPLPDALPPPGSPGPGMGTRIVAGGLEIDRRAGVEPWWLLTREGNLRLAEGRFEAVVARDGVRVRILSGGAWLPGPGGERLLGEGEAVLLRDGGLAPEDGPDLVALEDGTSPRRLAETSVDPGPTEGVGDGPVAPAPGEGRWTLAGRVLDAATREPIPRFHVMLLPEGDPSEVEGPDVRAFEDAGGRFAWGELRPGSYEVFVEAAGYALFRLPQRAYGAGQPEIEVELGRGDAIRGWVIDAANEGPVPDAWVICESAVPTRSLELHPSEVPPWIAAAVRTGPDGSFTLSDLPAGEHVLRVDAAGFAPLWVDRVELRADVPREGLILRLERGGGIEGRVTTADGSPLPGAFLIAAIGDVAPTARRLFAYATAVTDEQGRYRIDDLPSGFFMVLKWDSPEAPNLGIEPILRPAFVEPGRHATVDFLGHARGTRLFGHFLDAEGKPVANMRYTILPKASLDVYDAQWQAAVTDSEGRYSVVLDRPGTHLIYLTFGMGSKLVLSEEIDVPDQPELEHDVRTFGGVIRGRVLDGETHRPIERAFVLLERLEDSPPGRIFAGKGFVEGDGGYSFEGLRAGRYVLSALAADSFLASAVAEEIELAEADPTGPIPEAVVDVDLHPGGRLRIEIVDPDGEPVGGAFVEIIDEAGRQYWCGGDPRTGADGVGTSDGLEPGPYQIRARKDGYDPASAGARVDVHRFTRVRIVLRPVAENR